LGKTFPWTHLAFAGLGRSEGHLIERDRHQITLRCRGNSSRRRRLLEEMIASCGILEGLRPSAPDFP